MLFAKCPGDYENAVVRMEHFIENERQERGYIYDWLAWWDQRRSHFSKAFKDPSAPAMNLSEVYNSKYVTTNQCNLSLLEAAKRDTIEAMKFERAFKRFGEGLSCKGEGPSSFQRMGQMFKEQKSQAKSFNADAEVVEGNDESYSTRQKEWRRRSRESKEKGTGSTRLERFRKNRSKTFMKSFNKAKENKTKFILTSVNHISSLIQSFKVRFYNKTFEVTLAEKPACTCGFFVEKNKKQLETCAHIIWVLINCFLMSDDNPILQQIALTVEEIESIYSLVPNVSILKEGPPDDAPGSSFTLTPAEEQAIFEKKGSHANHNKWKVNKLSNRKDAKCVTCNTPMPAGKIFAEVTALYIPRNQNFAVERIFYYCASFSCMKKGTSSNVITPTRDTLFILNGDLSAEDVILLQGRGNIHPLTVTKTETDLLKMR